MVAAADLEGGGGNRSGVWPLHVAASGKGEVEVSNGARRQWIWRLWDFGEVQRWSRSSRSSWGRRGGKQPWLHIEVASNGVGCWVGFGGDPDAVETVERACDLRRSVGTNDWSVDTGRALGAN
ncbi:hypothetical protein E2562_027872 [Oryza meyeriana var. granulata]|uniref:Uncharacterized protein n=1 Tax=Oryza meyeriana var. granulata TaxID=110450 RepID=A0A6G1CTP7_9ORYZ|nr:hypothetical protein E2562_027872 [Oryza meyeriana var. granulata]